MSSSKMTEPQSIWKWPISVEGFLGATGAGAYIISAISSSLGLDYSQVGTTALALGILLVALSAGILILDLGRKERALYTFRNPSSPMTVGGFFLSSFLVIAIVQLALRLFAISVNGYLAAFLALLGIATAVGVLTYPGVLFGILKNMPLWNTAALPVLFLFSGLTSGGAVFTLLSLSYGVRSLGMFGFQTSMVMLAIYGLTFLVYALTMRVSHLVAAKGSIQLVIRGRLSPYFWIASISVGIIIPAAIFAGSSLSAFNPEAASAAGVCVIAGSLAMRYVLLSAAIPTPIRFSSALLYPKMKA